MYHLPGVQDTFDLPSAMNSYYSQLFPLNPGGIVPVTPGEAQLGLAAPDGVLIVGSTFHMKEEGGTNGSNGSNGNSSRNASRISSTGNRGVV